MKNQTKKDRTGYLYKRNKDGKQLPAGDKRFGIYYLQYDIAGKRYRKCLDTSDLEEAEQERKKIMTPLQVADQKEAIGVMKQRIEAAEGKLQELDNQKNPPLTIEDAWSTYLKSANRPDSGERTLKGYASQFEMFAKWLNQNHQARNCLCDVTPELAQEYASHLISLGFTENTFNKHMRLLHLVFRVLENKARIIHNPWSRITRKKEKKESRRELTVDEINTIINSATGEIKTLLILGVYTGLRLGDCCTLRWSEVDLNRGIILRVPNKTARSKNNPVHIPIHSTLMAILEEMPKNKRRDYVLPDFAARYKTYDSAVAKQLRTHFESCGIRVHKEGTGKIKIKDDNKKGKVIIIDTGKRAVVEVGFHSLRHSFVSLCREANAPLSVVESIVGHSNPAMTRHYTHVSELAASQAVAALPAFMNNGAIDGQSETDKGTSLPPSDILAELSKMTSKNWRDIRDSLVETLKPKSAVHIS